jgi:hypothetical protein
MTPKSALQKILKGIYTQKMKINIVIKEWNLLNLKRRADK